MLCKKLKIHMIINIRCKVNYETIGATVFDQFMEPVDATS